MQRSAASIVLLAWNEWELTQACLDSLRPTLGLHDEVILVDNGSTDGTAGGIRRFPWVRVVTNPDNRGFAGGCNQGAALASRDVVIFLNNDTLLSGRWLDTLLSPFSDPDVGATGPRSNFVSGPQLVAEVDYEIAQVSKLRPFVRHWEATHQNQTSEVERLVGFCLAVRRSTFESIGGFDEGFGIGGYEDDDLCARIRESGQRLLITHGSFVHHHGHRTFDANGLDWYAIQQENAQLFHAKRGAEAESRADDQSAPVLVSACLIVRDEQAILGDCLSSLEGLVDEIVVYDTGSTDGTVELARQAGAKVVEGYWDDNFGRARNAAMEHCTGQWILHIDADETIVGDVRATRDLLRNPATDDAILVVIDNLAPGRTGGMQHKACRLFRRVRGQWMGRLHEQVVARPGQPPLPRGDIEHIQIIHSGYLPELVEKRNKGERNTKLAEAELATDTTSDRSLLVFNLARSLAFAGRHEEAIERCREAKKPGGLLTVRRAAMRFGAELLLSSGRPTEALEWVDELRPLTDHPAVCDYLEGSARLFLGEHDRALGLLSSLDDIWDDDGISINSDTVLTRKGLALVAAGVWLEGADALLEVVQRQPVSNAWGPLVVAQWHAGRRFDEVVALLPDEQMRAVLAQMMFIIADAADSFANALWERFPRDPRLLGFAAHHAPRLDTPGCLEWASRLRFGGLSQHCPLIARARAEQVDHDRRLQAAAVAVGAFGDERGDGIVARLAPTVTADLFLAVLIELDELAPSLLPTFITHAATNAERCEAMADALEELGAEEQAQAIRMHAERIVA